MKPIVGANAVFPTTCVMTRSQRATDGEGKKNSKREDKSDEDDLNSDRPKEHEDHTMVKSEENSNNEKGNKDKKLKNANMSQLI